MNISEWFTDREDVQVVENRMSLLISLFSDLKGTEITEEVAMEILGSIATSVPDSMTAELTNIILLEMNRAKKIAMCESVVIDETVEPVIEKAPEEVHMEPDDEIEEPKIKIDRSELKRKEFDMDVLKEFGISIEDVANE